MTQRDARNVGGAKLTVCLCLIGGVFCGPLWADQTPAAATKTGTAPLLTASVGTPFKHLEGHPEILRTVPKLPLVEGCYRFRATWEKVACASAAENAKYPHPEYTPAIELGSTAKAGKTPPMPVTGGSVDIGFATLGSVTDTIFGSNYWSIQLNTNGFLGTNGIQDWVQFTDQHTAGTIDHLCIWNIGNSDAANPTYTPNCLDVPVVRDPRTGDFGVVEAYQDFDKDAGSTHYLLLRAFMSWNSDTEMYGVVTKDTYGLTKTANNVGRWNKVSGSIFGYGGGGTANFSKSTIHVMLQALYCKWEDATGCQPNPGPWSLLATNPLVNLSAGTAEQNNLEPIISYGPHTTHLPALNCTQRYACYIQYTGTAK